MSYDDNGNTRCHPHSRHRANARFRTVNIALDINQNLLDKVSEIAGARGISTFGQIRDFIEEGVRNYQSDINHGFEHKPAPCGAVSTDEGGNQVWEV